MRGRAIDLVRTSEEFLHASWAAAAGGGKAPIDLGESSYRPLAEVRSTALARGLSWWTLSPFSAGPESDGAARADQGPRHGETRASEGWGAGNVRTEAGELVDLSSVAREALWARAAEGPLPSAVARQQALRHLLRKPLRQRLSEQKNG